MTIGEPLATALTAVGTLMIMADDPWWVIGSAAVALHGADAGRIADVDVLFSVSDARRILPSIGIELRRGRKLGDFRSSIFGHGPQHRFRSSSWPNSAVGPGSSGFPFYL
jgi:hypothetical protein